MDNVNIENIVWLVLALCVLFVAAIEKVPGL